MVVRIQDNTYGGSGYDGPGTMAGSTAADPDLLARILRYTNPTPVDSALTSGGPPITAAQIDPDAAARERGIADLRAQLNAGPPLNINRQPMLGPNNPIASAAGIPVNLPPASAPTGGIPVASGRPGGIGSDANFPVMGAGGFPTTYFPPGQTPAPPTPVTGVPTPPVRPVTPTPATAYPAGTPGAPVAAPSAPGFGTIDRQNLSATGWNPGTRMGTALDLSGLFGMPSDVNPNVPSRDAQPVSGGALSKGSKLPKTVPLPPTMPDDIRAKRKAAAIKEAAKHSGFA